MQRDFNAPKDRSISRPQRNKSQARSGRYSKYCGFEPLEPRTLLSGTPFLAYLKIDGISGNSQDPAHQGWINVLGFSETVTHSGTPVTGGRAVEGPVEGSVQSAFEIVKPVDGTSPVFFQDAAAGKEFDSAELEIVEPGTAVIDYKLSSAIISSVTDAADASAALPTEQLAFTFQKIEWDFTPINADGSMGQTVSETWDFSHKDFPSPGLAAATTTAPQSSAGAAAFTAYLKIDGVDGSSQDANHKDWIEVLGYSEGLSRTGAASAASGAAASKVSFSDLSVLVALDKSMPLLYSDAATDKQIRDAELEIVGVDGSIFDYKLTKVLVSAVNDKADAGDALPVEQISLNFTKIEWDYTPLNADGSPGTTVSASASAASSASLAAVTLAAPPAPSSDPGFTAYLKIDGVDGESQDANHKDWIDVLSFSYGLSNTSSSTGGGGGRASKVSFSELTVLTPIDKSMPLLFADSLDGKVAKSAELDVVKGNGEMIEYKLSDVIVTSVVDAGEGGDSRPVEQIDLRYSAVEFDYTPLNSDGSPGQTISATANAEAVTTSAAADLVATQQASSGGSSGFLAYLKYDSVNGGSQNPAYPDWIDVLSFSYGVTQASSGSGHGGGGAGKVSSYELSVLVPLDQSMPLLVADSLDGKVAKTAELDVVKGNSEFLQYKLADVIITSIHEEGHGGDERPVEQIDLRFTKIEWDYTPVNSDGSPGQTVSATGELRSFVTSAAVALIPPPPAANSTPFVAYLKLDGVDGSSQDADHKDWIEVLSYSEGISRSGGGSSGAGAEGKVAFSDLSVLTPVDKSLPTLFADASSGKLIKSGELDVVEADGTVVDYKLSNVVISSISNKGSAGDSTPLEQINLQFTKIEWDFTPVNADGSPGQTVSATARTDARFSSPVAVLPAPQPSTNAAPFVAYLKLDGVDGSSQDDNHKDWIDVLGFTEGVTRTGSTNGSGRGAGKLSFSELTVLADADAAMPLLFADAASAKHIRSGELEIVEADGTIVDYKLSNVIVTSVNNKGRSGDSAVEEQIDLSFSKIAWTYTPPSVTTTTGGNGGANFAALALPASAALSSGGTTSIDSSAANVLFGDPKLAWLAYYRSPT